LSDVLRERERNFAKLGFKSAEDGILALKVCDMAVGSGHFLIRSPDRTATCFHSHGRGRTGTHSHAHGGSRRDRPLSARLPQTKRHPHYLATTCSGYNVQPGATPGNKRTQTY